MTDRSLLRRVLVATGLTIASVIAVAVWANQNRIDRSLLQQAAMSRYGQTGIDATNQWLNLIDRNQGESIDTKLERVNLFFNVRTVFGSDIDIWRQSEYWATPMETLARSSGDCEDFTIAKYITLLLLNVPAERLRLVYVRAQTGRPSPEAHMVLGYYETPGSEPRILDNLKGDILPASRRGDLTPVFSFNTEGIWAGGQRAQGSPTSRLSRWRDVLARIRSEGFQ